MCVTINWRPSCRHRVQATRPCEEGESCQQNTEVHLRAVALCHPCREASLGISEDASLNTDGEITIHHLSLPDQVIRSLLYVDENENAGNQEAANQQLMDERQNLMTRVTSAREMNEAVDAVVEREIRRQDRARRFNDFLVRFATTIRDIDTVYGDPDSPSSASSSDHESLTDAIERIQLYRLRRRQLRADMEAATRSPLLTYEEAGLLRETARQEGLCHESSSLSSDMSDEE
ncbi:hypothetical protein BDZ85DRAFT_249932 [Elsinoe ampelina]|uniref:Uncharacterized protein n=1 Tax=Elsinoe ampelina TaxID=302913 RepID=A0A6A6GBP6_9PEZI|nr:hypothetical protein BDZ85DRAFT_249932 [Elsinoe ampelina]